MDSIRECLNLLINSTLISTFIILIALWSCKYKFDYWKRRSVPSIAPGKSVLQLFQRIFGLRQFVHLLNEWYKEFEGHKYVGSFELLQPSLIIRDPLIIREMLIKSFSSFYDRAPPPDEESNQLSGGDISFLTGEKWRQVRQKVLPAFSSAKTKILFETLKKCAEELNTHLQTLCSNPEGTEIEIKELMCNYTMNVIAACAMGIKCNSIQDPNCEFKKVVMKLWTFDLRRSVYMILESIHAKLPKLFGLKALDSDVEMFLRTVCKKTMEIKAKDTSLARKDFLQILMSIRSSDVEKIGEIIKETAEVASLEEGTGPIFTENVLVGIISSFLTAGLYPVAATLTFCLYEVALHPDIQNKMFKEIQTVIGSVDGNVRYDDLKKFLYTDQVINETLRKYPIDVILGRVCTEPFIIPGSTVIVEKGTRVFIPVYSLHHDPLYFPEPDKFDPERFSENNVDKIVPGTFLPFGDGPRACIASRFALMDIKTMLITIVSSYKLHTYSKTQKKIEFDGNVITLSPKGEWWLQLQKRSHRFEKLSVGFT